MSDRPRKGDFLSIGLLVSVSWHVFWACLLVPVAKVGPSFFVGSTSVFLGPILKDTDLNFLEPSSSAVSATKGIDPVVSAEPRPSYFNKTFQQIYKPKVALADLAVKNGAASVLTPSVPASPEANSISFGFSDFGRYVSNVDFSDLKRIVSREDLFPFMDFKVVLDKSGQVKSLKKVLGCGDPLLDFYVMLKLEKAIFKVTPSFPEATLDIRFKLKE